MLARASILTALQGVPPPSPDPLPDYLAAPGACFVTLNRANGQLRGCIGSLEAYRPLIDDLIHNARAAAFEDPRFPPVRQDELASLYIHVSVLEPAEELYFQNEKELLDQIQPGIHGVIIQSGWHRATFLPSVWEQLPEPKEFLAALKLKAGIRDHEIGMPLRAWRYRVSEHGETTQSP